MLKSEISHRRRTSEHVGVEECEGIVRICWARRRHLEEPKDAVTDPGLLRARTRYRNIRMGFGGIVAVLRFLQDGFRAQFQGGEALGQLVLKLLGS